MARSVVVDAGFLVALINSRDHLHEWANSQALEFPPPWLTCEAALSEAFHLLGEPGRPKLAALLSRRSLTVAFDLPAGLDSVLKLIAKYSDVPMSLADACLVRMTETLPYPLVLTTDADFRVYRRHSRQVIPCLTPE